MIVLSVHAVVKHFGPEPVLDGVTFDVQAGDRCVLLGPNGSGKTTLLKILAAEIEADAGTVNSHPQVQIGYLQQHPQFASGQTVWEIAEETLGDLKRLAQEAETTASQLSLCDDDSTRKQLSERYDSLQQQIQQRDGYRLDYKIQRVLDGLGFDRSTYQQPVEQLSGGQRNRLMLAQLLLAEPDLMLLDEPSNHLDLEATEWLENYLQQSRQAFIIVSHDRYLLDRVGQRTLELCHGTVETYSGNYSAYQRQKKDRLLVQQRTYDRQQAEIAKLEDFVRRHHHGQKHAQAEDRRKKLERIEPVAPPREIQSPTMFFPKAARSGDIALRIEHLSKAFDQPLFEDLTFDVLRGEKWGVLGPNGCGKTTLLRCLLGECKADSGGIVTGTGIQIGYFDQKLDCLSPEELVVDAVRPEHKEFVEQQRRDLLARFGIQGDMVFQRVRELSGGERNRVALARLAAADANLLIFDEPTNHLDLWAREALENCLREFAGTVLLVSHDRYFLNRVVDHMLVVQGSRYQVITGNYETYLQLVNQGYGFQAAAAATGKTEAASVTASNRQTSSQTESRKKRKFPYRKTADLEADIQKCEQRIEALHQQLALPDILRDGPRVKVLKEELEQQQGQLQQLYDHWDEAIELTA
ncbi:MAG: ABC-F family ATP-binding cassette domain-containing protein [Pirellulaceae bacterium]